LNHGVSGERKHNYDRGAWQRTVFLSGFTEERHRAAEQALNEAQAYHALTVREAPRDREWAEKLANRLAIQ
jgi:hypothetical protein